LLKNIKAIVSDMDGVLWRGDEPLPGLIPLFDFLRERDLPFILATNNSRKTQDDYIHKLSKMGIKDIQHYNIITSGTATASYLQTQYPKGTKLYVIGGDGLKQTLVHAGFALTEESAEVVVCGIDFDLTYNKMRTATLQIRKGAPFIGTNPDSSFPSPEGLVPGAGSILAMLESASDVTPTIIGKPARAMFESALRTLGTDPSETLMLGDRIGTDIQGAQAVGIQTALVLTGVETEASVKANEIQPDFVFAGLPELIEALR
jgi:4-nitrophenyl phosphatase